MAKQQADLILLCNTDLPWEKDNQRECPDLEERIQLYHMYKDHVSNQPAPWAIISGTSLQQRLEIALGAIDQYLTSFPQ